MKDTLAALHTSTYDDLADEYEGRVEVLRKVTEEALSSFTTRLPAGSKILDVGCAVGYTIEILRQAGMEVHGIDISQNMIQHARTRNPSSILMVADFLEHEFIDQYDGILMYAFIHLFPKDIALECLDKAMKITKPGGMLFIATSKSDTASEGFEVKADYAAQAKRYRKHWTNQEIEAVFASRGLEIVNYEEKTDEFSKVWMDYIVRNPYEAVNGE